MQTTTTTATASFANTMSVSALRAGSSSFDDVSADSSTPSSPLAVAGSIWGSFGVIYILAKAIKRVLPIALEPLKGGGLVLTPFQWRYVQKRLSSELSSNRHCNTHSHHLYISKTFSLYILNGLFFIYAEGYKGFHLKFSPLVVKRSFLLQGNPLNFLLAPVYSMGLVNATRKRMIVSWCVSLGVTALVVLVKKLSPAYRCIMDAGVVLGLGVGSMSIMYYYLKSLMTGNTPEVDACLTGKSKSA